MFNMTNTKKSEKLFLISVIFLNISVDTSIKFVTLNLRYSS